MPRVLDAVAGFEATFARMFENLSTERYPENGDPTTARDHGLEERIACESGARVCLDDAIQVGGADNHGAQRYSPGERYAPLVLAVQRGTR